jgi:hypothetical protein
MAQPVNVHFALNNVPSMSRHRVTVRSADGTLLSGPSAEMPTNLSVNEGATIVVEASIPAAPKRNQPPARDEGRWELRANADSHAVLSLGRQRKTGANTTIQIQVDGAEQQRAPRAKG